MIQLEFDWEKYKKFWIDESGSYDHAQMDDIFAAFNQVIDTGYQPDTLVMSRDTWEMMQNALAAPAPRRRRRRR